MGKGTDQVEFAQRLGMKPTAKRKPTGFIAECQCGLIIGALDYTITDRKDAGRIICKWLADGCKIIPKFDSAWQATCNACRCDT